MDINTHFSLERLKELIKAHETKVVPKMELRVSPRFWEEELKPQVEMKASEFFSSTNPFGVNILLDDEVETYEFREVQP